MTTTPSTAGLDCPLHRMTAATETEYWNDSSSIEELTYAVARGATGATSNPTIVGEVVKKEFHLWSDRLAQIIDEHPAWTEDEIAMALYEEIAVRGASVLMPLFEREHGRKGLLSIQTNPKLYRDAERLTEQALRFAALAPNMQVKIPATRAGIEAIEEVTARGVSVNATVSFTVPQVVAVAEAVDRGLRRWEAAGEDPSALTPVATMMVGRLDDWLQVVAKRDRILIEPGYLHWAGIACFKKAYSVFREHGYRTRLLAAAYRHHLHWTELVGGNVVLTMPHAWQRLFNDSDIAPTSRIDEPVPPSVVDELYRRFPDFRRAYDIDGMDIEGFDRYGATVRTLRSFVESHESLVAVVRDALLPNPDIA